MATSFYAQDLIKFSLEKRRKAKTLLQFLLIESVIRTAATGHLSDMDITQMFEMETSVGDIYRSLHHPPERQQRRRATRTEPLPISPLALPPTPDVRKTRTEKPETKRRRISRGLAAIAALRAEIAEELNSDSV